MTANDIFSMAFEYYKEGKDSTALELFHKAASQGSIAANNMIGYYYDTGRGVAQDKAKACEYYRMAAEKGHVIAQYNLAVKYKTGEGVAQDYAIAAYWYGRSADGGDADAMYQLGYLYRNGNGVTQDYSKAFELYSKAAAKNNADGQNGLGYLYEMGFGTPVDTDKALYYYDLAAKNGSDKAKENHANLLKKLNAAQSAQTAAPQQQANGQTASGGFCTACGNRLNAGDVFCSKCGKPTAPAANTYTPPVQPKKAAPQTPPVQPHRPAVQKTAPQKAATGGNPAMGLLAALGGALISIAVIVLIGQLGFVAALGGLALGTLTFEGFAKFNGGKLTWAGILFCLLLIVASPYLANRIDSALYMLRYYGEFYFTWEPYGSAEASNLAMVYLFTALGAFKPIISAFKSMKKS